MVDKKKIEMATQLLLEGLGADLTDHNFRETPSRVARFYAEMFSPPDLSTPVFAEEYTDMVLVRGHEFYTLCPHHLLPVKLVASVAYMPNGNVIGASKLPRLFHDVNRMPMTQEKLTAEVVNRVKSLAHGCRGVAVMMRGEHGCMRIRGVKTGADMVTVKFEGVFDLDSSLQSQFFRLTGDRI